MPELGVGAVYWPGLEPLLKPCFDLIDVIEIEPQVFWLPNDSPHTPYVLNTRAFDKLNAIALPKILHGVGFPVGSCRFPDPRHIRPLIDSIHTLDAQWTSEHLAFNSAMGEAGMFHTGFFLPPQQTAATARAIISTIRGVAGRLPVPFAFENTVNYLRPSPGQMSDGDFIAEIAEGADCGILLDIHNLWTNERNGRQPVLDVIDRLPLDRVREVHLANGAEYKGYWLDAHSGYMPDELFALAREILPRLPNVKAVIFEVMSEFAYTLDADGMRQQLQRMHTLWDMRKAGNPGPGKQPMPVAGPPISGRTAPAEAWEDCLGALAIGKTHPQAATLQLEADPGLEIYRDLGQAARAGAITNLLRLTLRMLNLTHGVAFTNDLMRRYCLECEPENFAVLEASKFAGFLRQQALDIAHLDEVLEFECALFRIEHDNEARTVPFTCEPVALLEALGEGRLPDMPADGLYELEITPDIERQDGSPAFVS